MKANNLDRLIGDQVFKISKSDKNIRDYMIDSDRYHNNTKTNKTVK